MGRIQDSLDPATDGARTFPGLKFPSRVSHAEVLFPYSMTALLRSTSLALLVLQASLTGTNGQFGDASEINPFAPGADGFSASEEVTATLVSEVKSIAPGEPFTVAFKMVHDTGWHTYWRNSGYIQQSPRVAEWDLPEGFVAGELQWPVPDLGDLQGAKAYFYHGENYLLAEITPPDSLKPGASASIGAHLKWQRCDEDVCANGDARLSLDLPVAESAEVDPAVHAIFEKLRAERLPKPITGWTADAYRNAQGVQLVLTPGEGANPDPTDIYFFSADAQINGQSAQKIVKEDGRYILQLDNKNPEYEAPDTPSTTLPGVLFAKNGWLAGQAFPTGFDIAPKLQNGAPPAGAVDPLGGKSIALILWFALVGGLILNLMPCVFPVIGLKIMGFVNQAGEDRRKITLHGLVFTAGVILSFWVLSGIFFALRATTEGAGWGFQLQDPWFVFILMIVMLVLALNMAGVFEIGTGAVGVGSELTAKGGYTGSFFSGVLATVVATPCSAPFLGTALGAVATLPAIPFFAVFTAIAVGLSLPYIVLSIFPGLVQKLPKPGPWMESFKQGMSFLLFGTAGYMLWIYGGLVEDANQLYAIIGLAVIALSLWIYGRWTSLVRPQATRVRALVIALVFFLGGAWLGYPKKDALIWTNWSPEAVAAAQQEGRPVYIDFTARWCATCQTNKASYKDSKVRKAVETKNILLLKGDKTVENPAIEQALAALGEGAIPVNVLYLPGDEEPIILPKILTTGVVMEFFDKIPLPEKGQ